MTDTSPARKNLHETLYCPACQPAERWATARAANADTIDARLQDLDRYLLLYSATGDERFLDRFHDLGADFEKSLTSQKNAAALKDVWQRSREALETVRAAYSQSGVDLKQALAQSREVSELLDSIIVCGGTDAKHANAGRQPARAGPAGGAPRQ